MDHIERVSERYPNEHKAEKERPPRQEKSTAVHSPELGMSVRAGKSPGLQCGWNAELETWRVRLARSSSQGPTRLSRARSGDRRYDSRGPWGSLEASRGRRGCRKMMLRAGGSQPRRCRGDPPSVLADSAPHSFHAPRVPALWLVQGPSGSAERRWFTEF